MSELNISYENLTHLGDSDLKTHIMSIRAKINKMKKLNESTKNLEIYMCYAIRELETRSCFVQHAK
jgi:hypothetical protein